MKTFLRAICGPAQRLAKDTGGATIAVVAVLATTLVAIVGLGAETGLWFSQERTYQTAADAGALSGAWDMAHQMTATNGAAPTLNTTLATTNAVNNGAPATTNVTPTQQAGPAAKVVVSVPKSTLFASRYLPSVTLSTTAIATVQSSQACNLALYNGNKQPGVLLSGSGGLKLTGCKLASDGTGCSGSTSSIYVQDTGFRVSGNTNLAAASPGCIGTSGSFSCGTSGAVCDSGAPTFQDPLASTFKNFTMPATSCATTTKTQGNKTTTVLVTAFTSGQSHYGQISISTSTPGVVNGAFDIAPGTYYIDSGCGLGGDGSISTGNVTITCSACSGTTSGAGVTIIANGAITMSSLNSLNAPGTSSGQPYPGVLFYQPANWTTPPTSGPWNFGGNGSNAFPGLADTIAGNASQTLLGAIYLPGGWLNFTGDESTSGCFEIVSYLLSIGGNAANGMNTSSCSGYVNTATLYTAALTQ